MNVYHLFSTNPWNTLAFNALTQTASDVQEPALSWKEFPVLMTKNEMETMDIKHVKHIIKGMLLPPSTGALLNEKLFYAAELIDQLFNEAIKRYQKELQDAALKDKNKLNIEEAKKEVLAIQNKSFATEFKGYLREACAHRIAWLKSIDILEQERLKKTKEIILTRCNVLVNTLDKDELIDVDNLKELEQICKIHYYVFNENLVFGSFLIKDYLKEKHQTDLDSDLRGIKYPSDQEIEECIHIHLQGFAKPINPAEQPSSSAGQAANHEVIETKEVTLYRQEAAQGNGIAMYNLGWCYANGWGVKVDMQQAMHWFREAAEKKVVQAQYSMGLLYDSRMKLDRYANNDEAFQWYERAALQDFPPAQYMVGCFYEQAIAVNQDKVKACQWYEKAEKQKDKHAGYALGCMYSDHDSRKSFKFFLGAAQQGHSIAQMRVGHCYKQGEGVIRDEKEGLIWCAKATKQFNEDKQNLKDQTSKVWELYQCQKVEAPDEAHQKVLEALSRLELHAQSVLEQVNQQGLDFFRAKRGPLDNLYQQGLNYLTAKREQEAFDFFNQAAKEGHSQSQYQIGLCYFQGMGVPKDLKLSVHWLFEAADRGIQEAELIICDISLSGKGEIIAKDEKQWKEKHIKAAKQGNVEAMLKIANFYEYDSSERLHWLNEAVQHNSLEALYRLGKHYIKFDGDLEESETGRTYWERAAESGHAQAQYHLGMLHEDMRQYLFGNFNSTSALKYLKKAITENRQNLTQEQITKAEETIKYLEGGSCVIL